MDQNTTSNSNPAPVAAPVSPPPADQAAVAAPVQTPGATPQPAAPGGTPGAPVAPGPKKGKSMLWVVLLLILAFVCGLFVVAWYFQSQFQKVAPVEEVKPTPVVKVDKIVVGTDATFQPMEYVASEGAIVGYDIDLGNAMASEMGTKIEWKNIPWDDIFKALENKEIDMIMSSVSITDERKQTYDFSMDYLNAGQVIITRKVTVDITSAENLQGKKIAVQENTTNETEALKYTSEELVVRYPDYEQATQALIDGKVDAIFSDLPAAKGIVTQNPTLKIASDPFTNEYYGIVFRKGDPNVAKVNAALSALKTEGVLTDLKQKWLD